ncbi:MAG: trypsin-like peptidase domain-containing protein [Chloroflexota bacterium]|nr:trypsin-like peptidase domain-containing protein [Chloroflexota bacterium]
MTTETTSFGVASTLSTEAADVADRLLEGVVLVNSRQGSGSGTIWQPDGLIITNNHVVRGDEASVSLRSGERLDARVVDRDPDHDLASLRVSATDLPALQPGDSRRTHVGQWVLAAGNPMGMRGVVTAGIITGVGQVAGPDRTWLDDMIQADVMLAPGNSGGPLTDAMGQVLGINSMVASSGLALAIPAHVVERFLAPGGIGQSYLGISGTEVTVQVNGRQRQGVLLIAVESWSPAERAGLLQGDILLSLDGEEIRSAEQLRRVISSRSPEQPAEIRVLRAGEPRAFTVVPALRAAA